MRDTVLPDASEGTVTPPGLVYVSDQMPGITRHRRGKGFLYRDAAGQAISDSAERARIAALGIPPAYGRVWICPLPNGHLQATGLDALERKQYRYHPDWSAWRATAKFSLLPAFGAALGRLRARLERDLQRDTGDFAFSLAALVTLLDRAHLRVGNAAHTSVSRTYGATTLLRRHLTLEEGAVRLRFRAKGGRRVQQTLRGARLHRIFQEIDELPGRNLFTYLGEGGETRPIASHHVNEYLAEITGIAGVTAKTFRTWAGSVEAFAVAEAAEDRLGIKAMAEAAAAALHNTPAIARTSYVHPAILALSGLDAADRTARLGAVEPAGSQRLRGVERRMLAFLDAATGGS